MLEAAVGLPTTNGDINRNCLESPTIAYHSTPSHRMSCRIACACRSELGRGAVGRHARARLHLHRPLRELQLLATDETCAGGRTRADRPALL